MEIWRKAQRIKGQIINITKCAVKAGSLDYGVALVPILYATLNFKQHKIYCPHKKS